MIEQAAAARGAAAEMAAAEEAAQQKVLLEKALVPWLNVLVYRPVGECLVEGGAGGRAWRDQGAEGV